MRFAIAIPTDADSWRVVRRAEELGFTRAWFYDTQMLSADPFVAMAAAAMKTTQIRLGTGVLIPSNRIAPVAANAFASLNKLAPGRIDFGIGTGFTGRRAMGLGAVKLADMEDYIQTVMALLREETVEAEIEGKRRLIRLLNPELGLINTRDPIGLYIAASGPRARAADGEARRRLDRHRPPMSRAPSPRSREMRALWAAAGQAARRARGDRADRRRRPRRARAGQLAARHRAGRPARRDAAAPRRRRGADGLAGDRGDPARSGRHGGGLCRAGPQLPAARRALPRKPPRPSDVRQARGAAVHHRRPDPADGPSPRPSPS